MARTIARPMLRGNLQPSFSSTLGTTFGHPPNDWLQQKFDGTASYPNSDSFQPGIMPRHGAEVLSRNPLLQAATSQSYATSSLDTATFAFELKVWGAGDGTATQVVSAPGENVISRWPATLADGDYAWRMLDPAAGWTGWRGFRVRADAVAETLPAIGGAGAIIAAKAYPRFKPAPARLAGLLPGGDQRAAYDAMIARIGTIGSFPVPVAATANYDRAVEELPFAFDLSECYWVDANASHITTLASRVAGNGTTTGLSQWPWGSMTSDLALRFGIMAFARAVDTLASVPASLTAPQWVAAWSALATAMARLDSAFQFSSPAVWTGGGRWPGQHSAFGGHSHNVWSCATMAATVLLGQEAAITGPQAAVVAKLVHWLPWQLRTQAPMLTDDGTSMEQKGYGSHDTDFMGAHVNSGNALDYDWSAAPRHRAWAKKWCELYPPSESFHNGEGGDDYSLQWENRHIRRARAAGIDDYALQRMFINKTELQLASNRALDYHGLYPTVPSVQTLQYTHFVHGRYVTALHADPYNPAAPSFWLRHSPDGGWNHSPGNWGWTANYKGQAPFLNGSINDNDLQSPHSKGEGGMAATGNGSFCFGTTLTAASNGMRGGNIGRRVRTLTTQAEFDQSSRIAKVTQDLDKATDVCCSIPVTASAAYLRDIAGKPATAAEQTITITVDAGGTTFSVSGSASGSIAAGVGSIINNDHFYCVVVGAVVAGQTFVFQIQRVTKARDYKVWLPEGVLIHGVHYVFPTARNSCVRFYTRDVRQFSSATVASGILTITFAEGTGLPAFQSVAFELSGVTGGTAANAVNCNAVHAGAVGAGGDSVQINVAGLGVGDGTITGSMVVNLAPSAPGTITGTVTAACKSRAAGPLAVMQHIPVRVPTARALNSFAWFMGDAASTGPVYANGDELGAGAGSSVKYHRLHGRFEYGTLSEVLDWLTITAPDSVAITGVSSATTGVTPNRLTTANLTVNGTPYTFTYSEATGLVL